MTRISLTCQRCGKVYSLPPSAAKPTRQYCSNECRRTQVVRSCAVCGTAFTVKPSALAKGHGQTCSRACQQKSSRKGETVACATCGKPVYVTQARLRQDKSRYCSKACLPQLRPVAPEERFWSKVDIREPEMCWPWKAYRNEFGYGTFCYEGQMQHASRVVFALRGEAVPQGMEVLHSCDNPACVNPAHLSVGTHRDNMLESVQRGRHGGRKFSGERHPATKLTGDDVRMIRRLYDSGQATSKQLAVQYGLSTSGMWAIVSRKTWKHLH